MKESKFIDQNKSKWLSFEKLLRSESKDPDKLSDFFIKITDDLSYARTFFNNRSIRVYLNNICQQLFYLIYKSPKRSSKKVFVDFWKRELPTIAYDSRPEIITAFMVFFLSVVIGVVSSVHNPEFCKTILGNDYVNMTIENIESGDPMAVYKKMNEVDMFLGITLNNLLVSVKTFLLGILWAAGSLIILLYNGIMVGTFQYFFIEKGLFYESFLTIWLHGTLEISAIVIAGASGIVLGKGIIAPGSFSRLQAFQIAAKRGAKLFLGIVPIIVMAATIESFLTRYTDIPDALRLTLILLSLAYMVFYFWWYPNYVVNRGLRKEQNISDLQASPNFTINYHGVIKSGGDILRDTFLFYRKYGTPILRLNFLFTIGYVVLVAFFIFPTLNSYTYYYNYMDWMTELSNKFFDYEARPYLLPVNTVFFSVHSLFIYRFLLKDIRKEKMDQKLTITFLVYAVILNLAVGAIQMLNAGVHFVASFLISPLLTLGLFVLLFEKGTSVGKVFSRTKFLIREKYGFLLGLSFLITLISLAGYVFLNSPFPLFYVDFISWNIQMDMEAINYIATLINSFFSIFTTLLTIPLYMVGISLCYFSLLEIQEANNLRSQVENLGKP